MNKTIKGKAYVLGANIDTDQIIPAGYLVYNPAIEQAFQLDIQFFAVRSWILADVIFDHEFMGRVPAGDDNAVEIDGIAHIQSPDLLVGDGNG